MLNRILHQLQDPPRLNKSDIFLTLIPAILWLFLVYSRPVFLTPRCVNQPEFCQTKAVSKFDLPSIGLDNSDADRSSFLTQNLSGVVAAGVPAIWSFTLKFVHTQPLIHTLSFVMTDLIILAQTTAWNGFFTEISHLLYQRPRPFVYVNPTTAKDSSNYTSFYSGHTSFSAAATTAMLLTLFARKCSWVIFFGMLGVSQSLVISTAALRVLAGRHFLTDVICGAIAGTLIALVVAYHHRRKLAKV